MIDTVYNKRFAVKYRLIYISTYTDICPKHIFKRVQANGNEFFHTLVVPRTRLGKGATHI